MRSSRKALIKKAYNRDHGNSSHYLCDPIANVYFLKRVLQCIKNEVDEQTKEATINQIKKIIKEIEEHIKLDQGAESYTGLTIRK